MRQDLTQIKSIANASEKTVRSSSQGMRVQRFGFHRDRKTSGIGSAHRSRPRSSEPSWERICQVGQSGAGIICPDALPKPIEA